MHIELKRCESPPTNTSELIVAIIITNNYDYYYYRGVDTEGRKASMLLLQNFKQHTKCLYKE